MLVNLFEGFSSHSTIKAHVLQKLQTCWVHQLPITCGSIAASTTSGQATWLIQRAHACQHRQQAVPP